ncbi:MAG: hypothetical protein CUN55_05615 [Phototrophicales bacterium]|nr:MAG: hypothetical protein CUN55_05615 [Phototrophicales bacterium]
MLHRRNFLKTGFAWLITLLGWRDFGRATAENTPTFLLPPTTHWVDETQALIYYWLPENTQNMELVVLQDGVEIRRQPLPSARAVVKIEDLSPRTVYQYYIEAGGQLPLYMDQVWGPIQLRTQPYSWPIRLAVLGDSGFGDSVTAQLASHIAQQQIDFFVHLGDIVYRCEDFDNNLWLNWAHKYFLPFQAILTKVPHLPTVGNHDRDRPTRYEGHSFYDWVFPPLFDRSDDLRMWYQFVANDVQFLSLNTQVFFTDTGRQAQNTWLDEQLQKAKNYRTTIPFFHVPFRASTDIHPDDGLPALYDWESRFIEHRQHIGLVMSGHAHHYERLWVNGIRYLVSGGGSAVIYPSADMVIQGSQFRQSVAHYVLVDIYEDHIELNAYDLNNTLIDSESWAIEE